jgi:hypothetical protein
VYFGTIRRPISSAATKNSGRLTEMIYRKLGVSLTLLAIFDSIPFLAAPLSAAEGATPGLLTPPAAEQKSADNGDDSAGAEPGWRLIGGSTTGGGTGGAAVLHTAEFERSDPRLAGLMVRCGDTQGLETLIIVVEPIPAHAQPQVSLRTPEQMREFAGTVIPTGTGIRLSMDTAKLAALGLEKASEVEVKVALDGTEFEGAIALTGLPKALAWLKGECFQK